MICQAYIQSATFLLTLANLRLRSFSVYSKKKPVFWGHAFILLPWLVWWVCFYYRAGTYDV